MKIRVLQSRERRVRARIGMITQMSTSARTSGNHRDFLERGKIGTQILRIIMVQNTFL